MKKLILLVVLLITATTISTKAQSLTNVPNHFIVGDVGMDGAFTDSDFGSVTNFLDGKLTLTLLQQWVADCDLDGKVTTNDIRLLMEYRRGILISPLLGDMNANLRLDTEDADFIRNHIVGNITLTPTQQRTADTDQSGYVSVGDVVAITSAASRLKTILDELSTPRLEILKETNGRLIFRIWGLPGAQYRIEHSTVLGEWKGWGSVTLSPTGFGGSFPVAEFTQEFFRLVSP